MTDPFKHSYDGRTLLPNPNNASSDGAKPISFKTNVNRMKTKRWVEAKKISYDGDDWGDDEYGEYEYDHDDEEDPPPVPALNPSALSGASSSTTAGALPSTQARFRSPDRSWTMDPVGSIQRPSLAGRSQTADGGITDTSRGGLGANKSLPFMRPADIYKRMQEEKQRQEASRDPSPSSEPLHRPATESVAGASSPPSAPEQEGGLAGCSGFAHGTIGPVAEGKADHKQGPEQPNPPSVLKGSPTLALPEVKRLSTFDTGFLGSTDTYSRSPVEGPQQHQEHPQGGSQETSLQHNPSLGFRSVVHQAFDVPETPSTTTESLGRSNSDSTSALSPIMGNRGPDEDKTPTIMEDPCEALSTSGDGGDQTPVFKPGHRRDLSLPNPDNSPSKRLEIHDSDPAPQSALGEVYSVSPSDAVREGPQHPETEASQDALPGAFVQHPLGSSEYDLPPPLRLSTEPPGSKPSAGELPVIVPSISTDNSPQDTESDRLRKEIILSLSRENSPPRQLGAPYHESQLETPQGGPFAPGDYQRHLDSRSGPFPDNLDQRRPPIAQNYSPAASADLQSPVDVTAQVRRPELRKRFSWETSDSEASELPNPEYLSPQPPEPVPLPAQPPPIPMGYAAGPDAEPVAEDTSPTAPLLTQGPEDDDRQPEDEKPVLPLFAAEGSEAQPREDPPVAPTGIAQSTPPLESLHQESSEVPQASLPPSMADKSLLGFRDILGIRSSQERIRAFDRTRYQFASVDTGLYDWIEATILAHPEYSEIMEQNQRSSTLPQSQLPSKTKFPKLASLASHLDGSLPGSGHLRRTSAALGSQRGSLRGKEILHTAGLLGGKAGGAAKGLFAKGRSKFRSGGTDKVYQSTVIGRRKSLPHPGLSSSTIEDLQVFYGNNALLRTSIDLATVPKVTFPGGIGDVDEMPKVAGGEQNQINVASNNDNNNNPDQPVHESREDEKEEEESHLKDPTELQAQQDMQQPHPEEEQNSTDTHLPAVSANVTQQPSSSSFLSSDSHTTTHLRQTGIPQPRQNGNVNGNGNDNNDSSFGSAFDFEQELVAALRLDDSDPFSQGLLAPGFLSGGDNNTFSFTGFSRLGSAVVSDGGSSSRSSSSHSEHGRLVMDIDVVSALIPLPDPSPEEVGSLRVDGDLSEGEEEEIPLENRSQERDRAWPVHSGGIDFKESESGQQGSLLSRSQDDGDGASHGVHIPDPSQIQEDSVKIEDVQGQEDVDLGKSEELQGSGDFDERDDHDMHDDLEQHEDLENHDDAQEHHKIPEEHVDTEKHDLPERHDSLQYHDALNDHEATEKHKYPERHDSLEHRRILEEYDIIDKDVDLDRPNSDDDPHLTNNENLKGDENSEDHDDGFAESSNVSMDLKIAEATIVRTTRVSLLVNGQPVDTFHNKENIDEAHPSISDVSQDAGEYSFMDESVISKAEEVDQESVQQIDSHEQVGEHNDTQECVDSPAKKAESVISQDPEGYQQAEENCVDKGILTQGEKPGSEVAQETNRTDAKEHNPSIPGEAENLQSNIAEGPKSETALPRRKESHSTADQSKDQPPSRSDNVPTSSPRAQNLGLAIRHRSVASTSAVKAPQNRFYRTHMQSPIDQHGRQRSSTGQFPLSPVSPISSPLQSHGMGVSYQSQRPPALPKRPVESGLSGAQKPVTQTMPENRRSQQSSPMVSPVSKPGDIDINQGPGLSRQMTGQYTNIHSGSISSRSSGQGRQSLLRDEGGSSDVSKSNVVPSISTLSSTKTGESHRSFDSGRTESGTTPGTTSFRQLPAKKPYIQEQAPSQKSQSSMSRLKKMKLGIPHRSSFGGPRPDGGGAHKGTLNRLSELFRRPPARDLGKAPVRSVEPSVQSPPAPLSRAPPPQKSSTSPRPSSSKPDSPSSMSHLWFSPDQKYNPNNQQEIINTPAGSGNLFRGQPPPPGGYYAPSPPQPANRTSSFSGRQIEEEVRVSGKALEAGFSLSTSMPHKQPTGASYVSQHPNTSISSEYQPAISPIQSQLRFQSPPQTQKHRYTPFTHDQNNNNPPDSTPRASLSSGHTTTTTTTPAAAAPTTGNRDGEPKSTSESISNLSGHPHRGEARAVNDTSEPVELPITADDSSEEILMSSTAYPGQEWKPSGFSVWEY